MGNCIGGNMGGSERNLRCFCGSGKKHKLCHKDIMISSDFASLIKVYDMWDEKLKEVDTTKFKCKKGCNFCCYEDFSVTPTEFFYALYEYYKKYGEDKTNEIIRKGTELWMRFKKEQPEISRYFEVNLGSKDIKKDIRKFDIITEVNKRVKRFSGNPCIFLTEGGCSIYEARPFVCRIYPYAETYEKQNLKLCECTKLDEIRNYQINIDDVYERYKDLILYYRYKPLDMVVSDRELPMLIYCKEIFIHNHNIVEEFNKRKDIAKDSLIGLKIKDIKKNIK